MMDSQAPSMSIDSSIVLVGSVDLAEEHLLKALYHSLSMLRTKLLPHVPTPDMVSLVPGCAVIATRFSHTTTKG